MKVSPILTIDGVTHDLGLQIEYRDDLPASNAGYLDPHAEPRYIAVNRNLPRCEQVFTIAHELGHYLFHHNQPPRSYLPRLLDRDWKSPRVAKAVQSAREEYSRHFTDELQADRYAMSLLTRMGASDDLAAYLQRHPEKHGLCILASCCCFVMLLPRIVWGLLRKFFKLFWRA